MSSSSDIPAAGAGGLRGAPPVLGTLAFVGRCFLAVAMVGRRGGAAAAAMVAAGGVGRPDRPSGPSVGTSSSPGCAGGSELTDSVVGAPGAVGATGFDSDVPADDVWPLRSGEVAVRTFRTRPQLGSAVT